MNLKRCRTMLSLFAKPLDNLGARVASFCLIKRNKHSAMRRAHRLLFALLFTMLVTKAAAAVPLARYEASIHQAVVELTALEQWAKADSPQQHAARAETTLKDVRSAAPQIGRAHV